VFNDGWVCRACWKPNRPSDERCYRCKTPRDQQATVEAGTLRAVAEPGGATEGRLDAQFPLLAFLVSWPLRAAGAAAIGGGILVFLGAMLSRGEGAPPVFGMDARMFLGLLGFGFFVFGSLQIYVARSVQRFARWAYAIALVFALAGSLPRLLGLVQMPAQFAGGASTVWLGLAVVYAALAVMAVFLLAASFMGRSATAANGVPATKTQPTAGVRAE
jgi:hypothetical protein